MLKSEDSEIQYCRTRKTPKNECLIPKFGFDLAIGQTLASAENLQAFREHYLKELAKRACGLRLITDKMPQNFLYISLICSAFPEAKIIHVRRQAKATCWSNFKNYFRTILQPKMMWPTTSSLSQLHYFCHTAFDEVKCRNLSFRGIGPS